MTLDLLFILVLGGAAFLYAAFVPGRGRSWALLVGSVCGIYWLQPALPIRFSSFILQTTTVVLTVASWWLTRPAADGGLPIAGGDPNSVTRNPGSENRLTLAVIVGLAVLMALNRYLAFDVRITADRPPPPLIVAAFLALLAFILLALMRGH